MAGLGIKESIKTVSYGMVGVTIGLVGGRYVAAKHYVSGEEDPYPIWGLSSNKRKNSGERIYCKNVSGTKSMIVGHKEVEMPPFIMKFGGSDETSWDANNITFPLETENWDP